MLIASPIPFILAIQALRLAGLVIVLWLALLAGPLHACSAESDCVIGERHYRLHLPQDHDLSLPIGALFYAHGYQGSAKAAMSNALLRALADRFGLALVALKSAGGDWTIPNAPSHATIPGTDEMAYVDAVIEDLAGRIALDRDRLVATGFSAGGMMTWELACQRPARFHGFVPIAGTFWDPVPERCGGPAPNVTHIHGTTDRIVPLEGRRIAETKQGDVAEAMAMFRESHGFREGFEASGAGLACRVFVGGGELLLCTHPGGHSFSTEHLAFALERLLGPAIPSKR
ncbi:MAG: prolyl oligopeptidase family serine peptidase [Pseudomonadota bacterium]